MSFYVKTTAIVMEFAVMVYACVKAINGWVTPAMLKFALITAAIMENAMKMENVYVKLDLQAKIAQLLSVLIIAMGKESALKEIANVIKISPVSIAHRKFARVIAVITENA